MGSLQVVMWAVEWVFGLVAYLENVLAVQKVAWKVVLLDN